MNVFKIITKKRAYIQAKHQEIQMDEIDCMCLALNCVYFNFNGILTTASLHLQHVPVQ